MIHDTFGFVSIFSIYLEVIVLVGWICSTLFHFKSEQYLILRIRELQDSIWIFILSIIRIFTFWLVGFSGNSKEQGIRLTFRCISSYFKVPHTHLIKHSCKFFVLVVKPAISEINLCAVSQRYSQFFSLIINKIFFYANCRYATSDW